MSTTTEEHTMTANTADINDITMFALLSTGVDAKRVPSGLGGDEYVAVSKDGDTRVAFGPSVDVDGGDDGEADLGWDVCVYELIDNGEGAYGGWDEIAQEWFRTPAEVLIHVAHRLT